MEAWKNSLEQRLPRDERLPDTGELKHRVLLHKEIDDYFSLDELREMILELGIDYDNLPGERKIDKALELALLMNRLGRFKELLEVLTEKRPFLDWSEFE